MWTLNHPCPYALFDKNGKHTFASDSCDASSFIETVPWDIPRFFSKEGARYDNPGGGGANHHPSKSMHMWRGEAIAYIHLLPILDAIYMMQADLAGGKTPAALLESYTATLDKLQGVLPPPTSCGATLYCDHRPHAWTDFKPRYTTNKTLAELIVGKLTWAKDDEWKTHYSNDKVSTPLYLKIYPGSVGGWGVWM